MSRLSSVFAGAVATILFTMNAMGAEESPVFAIPRMNGVVIDGKADDWGEQGFRIELLIPVGGELKPAHDHNVRARLAWDVRGLLLLVSMADDVWLEHAEKDSLFRHDAIELFLAPQPGAADMCQWVIAPGMDPKHPELRWHLYDYRKTGNLRRIPAEIEAARAATDEGCRVEILLPWASLDITPTEGREIGFQMFVDDADSAREQQTYLVAWYQALGTFMHSDRMHRLRLSREAGPPVAFAV
ncbi:MAG: hypothetical protein FJ225_07880 [Lentisphaerae bacterium]|nr:hypothetical protein [Lentisphaerota bacterium]